MLDDDVIARLDQSRVEGKDSFAGTGSDDNLILRQSRVIGGEDVPLAGAPPYDARNEALRSPGRYSSRRP